MSSYLRVLLVLIPLVGLGCAKDRDAEDYKRAVAERDAAAFNAVNGHYTGLVKSPLGKTIGAVDLNLQTRFRTTQNTDGSSSIGTPTLVLELTFEDSRVISVSANDGSFNPDSGLFEATIPLTIRNGDGTMNTDKVGVSIVANVGGGYIQGSIQALGYAAYGNTFAARVNGGNIDDLADQAELRTHGPSEDNLQVTSYSGRTKFLGANVTKPVKIVVLQPRYGGDDDFYDLMVPVKNVTTSFNYDASAHILATNSRWDLRSGLLTGQVKVTTGGTVGNQATTQNATVSFTCYTAQSGPTSGSINCSHYTNQSAAHVADTQGTMQAAQGPDPVDDTTTAAAIDRTFHGMANGDADHGRQISLYVSYGARSRLQDIYDLLVPNAQKAVQVTFVYADSESVGFTLGLWDSATGSLDATADPLFSPVTPGHPLWLPEIHCQQFFLDKQKKPFTCTYKSNRTSQIQLKMQPR